ncbi:single-stranded-DNA-specific exonuclease RecJ [Desulfomarina sp.]
MLTDNSKIPKGILAILQAKGISNTESINKFLFPKLSDLPDPFRMKGMKKATALIGKYLKNNSPILIWGDYDVDGTTGTALLVNFFKAIGIDVQYHIPNRMTEGYGLNTDYFTAEKNFFSNTPSLVITVDCGISDGKTIAEIQHTFPNIEFIVSDHHTLPCSDLPGCITLNPSDSSCGFHSENLAGVGVAFYLAAGIRSFLVKTGLFSEAAQKIQLKDFLAFVALGTVADMVKLTPTNRILVRAGFEALENTNFPGLQELLRCCDISDYKINSEEIAFLIGPLLNAPGRLGDSELSVKTMTAGDSKEAKKFCKMLLRINNERKDICNTSLDFTLTKLNPVEVEHDRCAIVQGDIHLGVAGIVASKLVELHKVPVIVLGIKKKNEINSEKTILSGSLRSIDGIDIVSILEKCSKYLIKFGGHDMAAGISLYSKDFQDFKKIFVKNLKREWLLKSHNRDNDCCEIRCSLDELYSSRILQYLKFLEPFGPGNDRPVFIDENATIISCRKVGGGGTHLQVSVRGKTANYKGIGFGFGELLPALQKDPYRKIIYSPTINRYRGTKSWQIRIIDII